MRKKKELPVPLLYLITDPDPNVGHALQVGIVSTAAHDNLLVQFWWDSDWEEQQVSRTALDVTDAAQHYGVPVVINRDIELARRLRAEKGYELIGVHVNQQIIQGLENPDALMDEFCVVGGSARDLEQLLAVLPYVDYVGIGPVGRTRRKEYGEPIGVAEYQRLAAKCREMGGVPIPIGGIQLQRNGEGYVSVDELGSPRVCVGNDLTQTPIPELAQKAGSYLMKLGTML